MAFSDKLNEYLNYLNCTARELAECSDLSTAAISRYRTGDRTPSIESEQLQKLVDGIALLSQRRSVPKLSKQEVLLSFQQVLSETGNSFPNLSDHLNALINTLKINITELSRFMNFDASYISRIRSGERRPADAPAFADSLSRYISTQYSRSDQKYTVSRLIECSVDTLENEVVYQQTVYEWLASYNTNYHDSLRSFLNILNHPVSWQTAEEETDVAACLNRLPDSHSRIYYGIDEMNAAELDFLYTTLHSESTEAVFLCSDINLDPTAFAEDFENRWIRLISAILRRGIQVQIIFNVNVPLTSLIQVIQRWLPLLMTGNVHSYYLRGEADPYYGHLHYLSGAAALCGECITEFEDEGRYYLTTQKEELEYYRKKVHHLLEKADPLIENIAVQDFSEISSYFRMDVKTSGRQKYILNLPPVFILSDELIDRLLHQNTLTKAQSDLLPDYIHELRTYMQDLIGSNRITLEIPLLSEEHFSSRNFSLNLPLLSDFPALTYSYQDYLKHMDETRAYAALHPELQLKFYSGEVYENLSLYIHEGRWVFLVKSGDQPVQFLVQYPKLRNWFSVNWHQ